MASLAMKAGPHGAEGGHGAMLFPRASWPHFASSPRHPNQISVMITYLFARAPLNVLCQWVVVFQFLLFREWFFFFFFFFLPGADRLTGTVKEQIPTKV